MLKKAVRMGVLGVLALNLVLSMFGCSKKAASSSSGSSMPTQVSTDI